MQHADKACKYFQQHVSGSRSKKANTAPKKYENLSFVVLDVLLWRARTSSEVYLTIHKGLESRVSDPDPDPHGSALI
jgi:hypothetical protein